MHPLASPVGLTIVIIIVLIVLVFRRRLVAFLTQPVPNPNYDPNVITRRYWIRSRQRIELVGREMELLEHLSSRGKLNERIMAASCAKLRKLADEQRAETVPHPALEAHKDDYFQIMDIQARKVEDIIATGGANLEALVAEEEELWQQTNARRLEATELMSGLGLTLPDLSDPSRF